MEYLGKVISFFSSASPELLVTLVALAGMLVIYQSLRLAFRLLDKDREQ